MKVAQRPSIVRLPDKRPCRPYGSRALNRIEAIYRPSAEGCRLRAISSSESHERVGGSYSEQPPSLCPLGVIPTTGCRASENATSTFPNAG